MSGSASHMPAILFGLGATKAGTSWLHDYLASHPQVHMPAVKELHYFDAQFFRKTDVQIRRLAAERQSLEARLPGSSAGRVKRLTGQLDEIDRLAGLMAARTNDGAFAEYLVSTAQGARVVGDITPAYGLLPARLLARMARLAPSVRFTYLMRDPVDRLWSHVRMIAGRLSDATGDFAARVRRIFDVWAGGGQAPINARSDYAGALERMGRAIAPENLLVLFYERLFTPEAIARLTEFLGLSARPADFGLRVHAGIPLDMDPARRARAQALLRPQYDYVARQFGDLPLRWRENMGE